MSSPAGWITIAAAGVGVLGAVGGAAFNHLWTMRRDQASRAEERKQREEQWTREDEARTFDRRVQAYLDFLTQWRQAEAAFFRWQGEWDSPDPPDGSLRPLFESLTTVEVFGSTAGTLAARDACRAMQSMWDRDRDECVMEFTSMLLVFRRDLGVKDDPALLGFADPA